MSDKALTSKSGGLWVQPDGPNTEVFYLGCHTLGDISQPLGDVELIRCFDPTGKYKVVGDKVSPPDKITTSIEELTYAARTWLEKVKTGSFSVYAASRSGGRADQFLNYVRMNILMNTKITSISRVGIVHREEDNDAVKNFDISATDILEIVKPVIKKQNSSETLDSFDISMVKDFDDSAQKLHPGDIGIIVSGASLSPEVASRVMKTKNAGATWSFCAVAPFDDDLRSIVAAQVFKVGANTIRFLVAIEAEAGNGGKIAYSDDEGATWTVVSIGGATAGHGATKAGCLFALDEKHIWLGSANGYIYFSDDGGQTWTAQESGTITTDPYSAVHFSDPLYGMAVSGAGITAFTLDGGQSWNAATAIDAGDDVTTVSVLNSERAWIGTAGGHLYYTLDFGTTWYERTGWIGSSEINIEDLVFINEYVGWMVGQNGSNVGFVYRTFDGGYSWEQLTTPSNAGLSAIDPVDENFAFSVGAVSGTSPVILKISD